MAETATDKVALLDPHDVEIEVDAAHAHILEGLGWVRVAQADRAKKEPSRRAKILPAAVEDEEEDPPPKPKARRD